MSERLQVVGGFGGVEVRYDDLAVTAHVLEAAALDVIDTAWSARRVLTDPGLLASGVLDPTGFGRVEAAVLAAVVGPRGLLMTAGRLTARSLSLRAAVLGYEAADRLGAGLRELRHWAESAAAVVALPLLPLVAISPVGMLGADWLHSGSADAFLAEHPGVAEDAAGSAPAFLDTLLTIGLGPVGVVGEAVLSGRTGHPFVGGSLEDATRMLGLLYPPGTPAVLPRGTDAGAPSASRGVGDLLAALDHRDALASGATQGEIDVRRLTVTDPDGRRHVSWVVDLPGTKEWQFDPRHRDHLNDLATNLTTMAGDRSARIDGVTRALLLAGVGKDEPVMLVGHSQGGLVAMRAAEQYARDGSFHVTHVVTAGSPTARMQVPASVSVLSLENRFDIVPQLDGEPPPAEANRVTVLFDAQHDEVGRNHATATTYLPAAREVDRDMSEPSLAAWREGAAAFLPADSRHVEVTTTVWDIRNSG